MHDQPKLNRLPNDMFTLRVPTVGECDERKVKLPASCMLIQLINLPTLQGSKEPTCPSSGLVVDRGISALNHILECISVC